MLGNAYMLVCHTPRSRKLWALTVLSRGSWALPIFLLYQYSKPCTPAHRWSAACGAFIYASPARPPPCVLLVVEELLGTPAAVQLYISTKFVLIYSTIYLILKKKVLIKVLQ